MASSGEMCWPKDAPVCSRQISCYSACLDPHLAITNTQLRKTLEEENIKLWGYQTSKVAVFVWNGGTWVSFDCSVRLLCRLAPTWHLQLSPHVDPRRAQEREGKDWNRLQSLLPQLRQLHLLPLPCNRLLLLLLHQEEKVFSSNKCYHLFLKKRPPLPFCPLFYKVFKEGSHFRL